MLLLLCFAVVNLKGQTQPYGMIDTADLKIASCDFEKGANVIILSDKTGVNIATAQTLHPIILPYQKYHNE